MAIGEFFRGEDPEVFGAEVELGIAEARRQLHEERMTTEAALALLDEIRARFADVPDKELEREVERAAREVRAEMRAERERGADVGNGGDAGPVGTDAPNSVSS